MTEKNSEGDYWQRKKILILLQESRTKHGMLLKVQHELNAKELTWHKKKDLNFWVFFFFKETKSGYIMQIKDELRGTNFQRNHVPVVCQMNNSDFLVTVNVHELSVMLYGRQKSP